MEHDKKIAAATATERKLNALVKETFNVPNGVRDLQSQIEKLKSVIAKMQEVEKTRLERIRLGKLKKKMHDEKERIKDEQEDAEDGLSPQPKKSKIIALRDSLLSARGDNKKQIRQLELTIGKLKREIVDKQRTKAATSSCSDDQNVSVSEFISTSLLVSKDIQPEEPVLSLDEELRNLSELRKDVVKPPPPKFGRKRLIDRRIVKKEVVEENDKSTSEEEEEQKDDFESKFKRVYNM